MEALANDKNIELLLAMARLRYADTNKAGISRHLSGKKFYYLDNNKRKVTDPVVLERIAKLVLPPAWTNVWISTHANGHIQATGYDIRGRKQYRYHAEWIKFRSEEKFSLLFSFGKKLPQLRKQLEKDIRIRTFNKDKICALALSIMIETSIRVGNAAYEKANGSFGLTTLKSRHISFKGSGVFFKFKGKKGVRQEVWLKKPQLTRMLNKINDLPGQTLFQYYAEDGVLSQLTSDDLNDYIRNIMGEQMSCKVVRTWSGCVHFLVSMAQIEPFNSAAECKRNILLAIDEVAIKLGNTRSVCKNYYIHPELLNYYQDKKLDNYLPRLKSVDNDDERLRRAEKNLIQFLGKLTG